MQPAVKQVTNTACFIHAQDSTWHQPWSRTSVSLSACIQDLQVPSHAGGLALGCNTKAIARFHTLLTIRWNLLHTLLPKLGKGLVFAINDLARYGSLGFGPAGPLLGFTIMGLILGFQVQELDLISSPSIKQEVFLHT